MFPGPVPWEVKDAASRGAGDPAGEGDETPPECFGDEWELIWADEFNYEGVADQTKWDYEVGFIRNREKQYYTKQRLENARVENGTLVIESRKEKYKKAEYTSASLHTWHKAPLLHIR